jgi:hypothetical protein
MSTLFTVKMITYQLINGEILLLSDSRQSLWSAKSRLIYIIASEIPDYRKPSRRPWRERNGQWGIRIPLPSKVADVLNHIKERTNWVQLETKSNLGSKIVRLARRNAGDFNRFK